ncbi:MAG: ribosome silencing factor [Desulfatirhabdiaceae bacterium]|jgi:ribosome-associated protein
MNMNALQDPILSPYITAAMGKKAYGIRVMAVGKLTSIADYFIICSARSSRQVSAIAEHIQKELKSLKKKPLGIEGTTENHWVLMDYGDVIIHVFYEPVRQIYNLEGLWRDAPGVTIPDATDDADIDETGEYDDE